MKSKSVGGEVSVPYGMAVWSAGIGTRPVIMDFMQQIGQVWISFEAFITRLPIYVLLQNGIAPKFCGCISKFSLLEQTNRRALATNEWLRVRECEGVYAIGDCATVSQRKIMVCVKPLILYLQIKPVVLTFQLDSS